MLVEFFKKIGIEVSVNKTGEFKDTGGFEKLGEQFLPEEKAYFKANDIPFYF